MADGMATGLPLPNPSHPGFAYKLRWFDTAVID